MEKNQVTKSEWDQAQINERKFHDNMDYETGIEYYRETYRQYFSILEIDPDLKGKTIIEIGPADFPGLAYCKNEGPSIVIEPMPSEKLIRSLEGKNVRIITDLAEHFQFPKVDEVWIMNVLQHTMDPKLIIEKSKRHANLVKFFEPIHYGTDDCHLHNFSIEYFYQYFGECVRHYPRNKAAVKFHAHECSCGVWRKEQK